MQRRIPRVRRVLVLAMAILGSTAAVQAAPVDWRMYVANEGTSDIAVFNSQGLLLQRIVPGSPFSPRQIQISAAGTLLIADYGSDSVREFTPEGNLIRTIGTQPMPHGLAIGPDGRIYVSGSTWGSIFNPDGSFFGSLQFQDVAALTVSADSQVLGADNPGGQIRIADLNGTALGAFSTGVGSYPRGVATGPEGQIYIARDLFNDVAVHGDPSLSTIASPGLRHPYGIALGPNGHLFVTSFSTDSIFEFTLSGVLVSTLTHDLHLPDHIAFGPPIDLDGDGLAWPEDCNDTDGAVHPGAREDCNGRDDDCNGLIDDGPGCVRTCRQPGRDAAEVRVTADPGRAHEPESVWTGAEYGVVWENDRDGTYEVFFTRLDAGGAVLGSQHAVTSSDGFFSGIPAVVWTGSEYGVAWQDGRDGNNEIYFARLDASGAKIGADTRVTSESAASWSPRLAWNGAEYGLVWMDQRDGPFTVYFARLDRLGQKVGGDVRLTFDSGSFEPEITGTGTGYAIAWVSNRAPAGVYFARFDAAGNRLGTDIRESDVQAVGAARPGLVWTGSGYGLSWIAAADDDPVQDGEIYAARLDASGARIGPEIRVTDDEEYQIPTEIAWSGEEFAIASYDYTADNVRVFVRTIGASGARGATIPVAEEPTGASEPSIAWTGHGFALIWEDSRSAPPHGDDLFFATVSCCSQGDRDHDHVGDLCDLDDGFIAIDFSDGATLAWQPEAGLQTFDLYRGRVSLLHDGNGDGAADDYGACLLAQGSASTTFADPAAPPSRDAFFYIAAGSGPAGSIGLGNASSGAPRVVANPQLCP